MLVNAWILFQLGATVDEIYEATFRNIGCKVHRVGSSQLAWWQGVTVSSALGDMLAHCSMGAGFFVSLAVFFTKRCN